MRCGRCTCGEADEVYFNPKHPYTEVLWGYETNGDGTSGDPLWVASYVLTRPDG